MFFGFAPVTDADIAAILAWRYPPPYEAYNATEDEPEGYDPAAAMRDTRSPYYAARLVTDGDWERQEPVGFFAFGSSCEVGTEPDAPDPAHLRRADGSVTVGLGLRPDLTGSGMGLSFVQSGLAMARVSFQPPAFRLFVYAWNQRAVTVYRRAGFMEIGRAGKAGQDGLPAFIEMTRPA